MSRRLVQGFGWTCVLVNAVSWWWQVWSPHQNVVLGVSNFIGMIFLILVLIRSHFDWKERDHESGDRGARGR